jgi:uncharacterized membrane protein YidH (DUF202 family)
VHSGSPAQLALTQQRQREESVKLIGIVLIILGLVGVIYGGISWTRKDTILDAGPLEISTTKREGVPLPPIVGAALLVGGVVLVMKGK